MSEKNQERQRQKPISRHRHTEKPPEQSPAVAGQQLWVTDTHCVHASMCHSESALFWLFPAAGGCHSSSQSPISSSQGLAVQVVDVFAVLAL